MVSSENAGQTALVGQPAGLSREADGQPAAHALVLSDSAARWEWHGSLTKWDKNPRHNLAAVPRVAASIVRFGFVAPIVVWLEGGRMVAGHTRLLAMAYLLAQPHTVNDAGQIVAGPNFVAKGAPGPGIVRVVYHSFASEQEADLYALADNRLQELSTWDDEGVASILAQVDEDTRSIVGFGLRDLQPESPPPPAEERRGTENTGVPGALQERFVVPPFTVLDGRQGYWQDRKRAWIELGVSAEEGRENLGSTVNLTDGTKYEYMSGRGSATGGSIFDPVLCEVAFRWFCPPGGRVLDPFAGECTKGVVAGVLGLRYTAVELRQNQVDVNEAAWDRIAPKLQASKVHAPEWTCGDSEHLDKLLPAGELYDFVWTSPPYYDLEIYSESDKDGSAFATYEAFMAWYERIFAQCVGRLRENCFLGVKVGEVRDKKTGAYRNFVGDNVAMFMRLGLHFYNEAILVTPLGTVPIRAGKHLQAGRKLGKTHQNVLIFYKGDTRHVGKHHAHIVEAGDVTDAHATHVPG